MVFDAAALWWPPFQRLYNQLETLKLEPSSVSADALKASLSEYEPWLAKGPAGAFRPPSEASRKALEAEASLSIGAKKLPVEAGLRGPALDVSRALQLDEIQAYVLLRRWVAKAGPAALADAGSGGAAGGGAQPSAALSPAQLHEVAQLYFSERLYLLKSVEDLLWEGERAEGGPQLDVVEGALSRLLEQNLEDAVFQALQANLEPPAGAAAAGSSGMSAALAAIGPFGGAPTNALGHPVGAAAASAAVSEARSAAAAAERCSLLNILILIYYHPRKQCTPDRFVSLAKLFHSTVFTQSLPRSAGDALVGGADAPSPAQLSVKLATLLLLEMLDVDKVLAALASPQPIDEAAYAFAAPAVKQRVNAELSSWWPSASAAHAPVLLAWAAVLCLIGRSADGRAQHGPDAHEFEAHAAKAQQADALGMLSVLTTHAGLQPNAVEMYNNVVLSTMSAAFCAFDFSPAVLALPQLDSLVRVMANLFRDQPALCEGFWAGDRITDEPLRRFLNDVRGLYPALPAPLYTLLAALSSTADSAAAANAYLAQLSSLTCLHVLPDVAIEQDCNEDGDLYARQPVPLPGARGLTLPQGALGEVAPLPEGLATSDSLWTVPAGEDLDHVQLVRWRLTLPDGAGQWIMLSRMAEALSAVQQSPPGVAAPGTAAAAHTSAALEELAAALQLLAALCVRDPQTALELLHVELPVGSLEGGQRGPDLLSLACQAAVVLAQLPDPHAAAIGDCLSICAALAEGIPGRVAAELLSLCGVPPAVAAGAVLPSAGQVPDVPLLGRVLAAETSAGRYPATQAFLRLLTTLVSAASPAPALQVLVLWVLYRVLAEHRQWRYAQRAERWRLASLGLRLVRLALLSAPTSGPALVVNERSEAVASTEGGAEIAAAVASVLRYDVGMTACVLSALPFHAAELERTLQSRFLEAEVIAIEECCIQWHHLLPVLLPVGSPDARLAPAAFFRPCASAAGAGAAGGDGASSNAAAVLLSYVSYPFFGTGERALVMRSMHCLASAAAAAAPGAVFAVLLPQESPEAGVASAARSAIAAAFAPDATAAAPQLVTAACDVLVTAVECHPSLLDALLFPCGLEQALLDKENRSSNASTDASAGKGAGKAQSTAPRSCLDALWELLQRRKQLQEKQPHVLAKLLQVLAAMWQSSGAFRAVAVLQRQPEFWGHIVGVVEGAAEAGAINLPAAAPSPPPWAEHEAAASLVSAEASALQILAAEWYTWAASAAGRGSAGDAAAAGTSDMPADVASLLRRLPAGLAPQLLERYAAPLPTASLVRAAQQGAAAAGLQLLGAALSDDLLWRSMAEGASLVPQLAAAAQPLLRQFGGQAEAARALADHASTIAARNFRSQQSAVAISQLVMQQAEVRARVAADREFGAAFLYDAQLLARRLGTVLEQHLDQLQGLSAWLRGVSVAASLEDARLAAITALKTLLSAAHDLHSAGARGAALAAKATAASASGGKEGSGASTAALRAALATLSEALTGLTSHALGSASEAEKAAAQSAAVDVAGAHLLNAAEAACIVLVMAQQWAAGRAGAPDEGAAAPLCAAVLQATGDWLTMLSTCEAASLSSSPDAQPASDSVLQSLLVAALVLLPLAPAGNDAKQPPSADQQRLQDVATQLLPLLLAACHRQPPPQLVLVVSLAAALINQLVPSSAWLPLVRSHLHFGNLLQSMLLSLHSAAQASAQQRQAAATAALALPPLPAGQAGSAAADAQRDATQAHVVSPLAAASAEEAVLLLAMQVAQSHSGAALLVEQVAVGHALALGKWLLAAEGGNLMGETPASGPAGGILSAVGAAPPASGAGSVIDYSNAYRQDGTPNPMHRLWCCVLSLLAFLLSALPGHATVEEAALQLAIEAEPRLLLAAEPPAAGPQQPLTLAMAQETKFSLFFLCGLARLSGQWRLMLPNSLPAFRRATASFLAFAASPGAQPISCSPVSASERAAARADAAGSGGAGGSSSGRERAALVLERGWFGAVAAGASSGSAGDQLGGARCEGYAWQLAERLYSSAQYALAFQLAVSPEVGEEELAELGPEWVRPATLLALQGTVVEALPPLDSGAPPAARRLARTLQALLGLSSQLQDGMGAQRSHAHKQAVGAAITRLSGSQRAGSPVRRR